MFMILNGKGSNCLWSTWVQSCFRSFLPVNPIELCRLIFIFVSNVVGFVCLFLIIVEQ